MGPAASTSSAAILRSRLGHPVIDADGHTIEFMPALSDYIRAEGVEWPSNPRAGGVGMSLEERVHGRVSRSPWWALPTKNTRDYATATMPKLFYERLEELGIDVSIVYPSIGLTFIHADVDDLRRGLCRALNRYHADIFRDYSDRLIPVGVVPLHTPEEGIEELDYTVNVLGFKAILIPSFVRRPVPAALDLHPDVGRWAYWLDPLGLDSAHDYDPFWAKCLELKVSVTTHSLSQGIGFRQSVTNYMYNHIGHFAASGEAVCKALLMGGVTRRFPRLRVGFLEGGVSWACQLYADTIGHWEKRNGIAIDNYNPAHFDRAEFKDLLQRYGGKLNGAKADDPSIFAMAPFEDGFLVDEWAAAHITRPEDIRDLFEPNFFFGCEADDPLTSLAFDTSRTPFGARLNAMFSSDVGHWDVPDMSQVLEEAFETVEEGHLSEEDFRDFVFTNVARFYTDSNPDFFKGTIVEGDVDKLLAKGT